MNALKHPLVLVAVGLVAGYVLAPMIAKVPLVNKLPQFGKPTVATA